MQFTNQKQKLSPTQRLMRTREFDQDSLDANRSGQLSQKQKFDFRMAIVAWTIALMAAYLIVIGGTLCGQVNRAYGLDGATGFLVLNMITPIVIDFILLRRQQQRFAVGHVEAFTGHLVKPAGSRKYTREHSHLALVNKAQQTTHVFEVDGSLHDAFVEGEIYTVYAWPFNERHILSAEHTPNI